MTTETIPTVHRYDDETPGSWQAALNAMHSGEVFECDEDFYMYWLEVLPPRYMNRRVTLPSGRQVGADFGFAEGADYITAFWTEGERFFGCRTNAMSRGD